jgi:hypothetical protein
MQTTADLEVHVERVCDALMTVAELGGWPGLVQDALALKQDLEGVIDSQTQLDVQQKAFHLLLPRARALFVEFLESESDLSKDDPAYRTVALQLDVIKLHQRAAQLQERVAELHATAADLHMCTTQLYREIADATAQLACTSAPPST